MKSLVGDIQSMKEQFLPFKKGDTVTYRNQKGTIVDIEGDTYIVQLEEGFERWLTANELEKV